MQSQPKNQWRQFSKQTSPPSLSFCKAIAKQVSTTSLSLAAQLSNHSQTFSIIVHGARRCLQSQEETWLLTTVDSTAETQCSTLGEHCVTLSSILTFYLFTATIQKIILKTVFTFPIKKQTRDSLGTICFSSSSSSKAY